MKKLSREDLIVVVTRIMEADGTEEEINNLITVLEDNVVHPEVTDLIFYPDKEMTPEDVVDTALSYRPVPLD